MEANSDFVIEEGAQAEHCGSGGDDVIPNSTVIIGYNAFLNCTSMTGITLPNSVTSIGLYAFGQYDDRLTIRCYNGSNVQDYADYFGYVFV